MKKSFSSFTVHGKTNDKQLPVLLICNHISWWDGIWALYLNQQHFKRKYHFMMLEDQLRKNWFFQYTGGFSISKKSRSIIESLNYASELLQNKENLVLMFPQGKIQSMHQHKFIFEKGVQKIIEKTPNNIQVIFLVNIIDYFSEAKPHLNLNVKEYEGSWGIKNIEEAYNSFYKSCINRQAKMES